MKVKFESNEWFPVYTLCKKNYEWLYDIELTEDEFRFIKKAQKSFKKAQDILQLKVDELVRKE